MLNRIENLPIIQTDHDLDLEEYENLRKYTRGRKTYELEEIKEEIDQYLG